MDTQNGTARGGVAIVTGGSRGLGRDMVRSIAGRGTDVIFTYQSNSAAADELVAEVEGIGRRAAALQLDVGDTGTFDAFAEKVKDVLRDWGTDSFQFPSTTRASAFTLPSPRPPKSSSIGSWAYTSRGLSS